MSGFDDRNRYSYSGADARAYAFYPLLTSSERAGVQKEIVQLEKEIEGIVATYANPGPRGEPAVTENGGTGVEVEGDMSTQARLLERNKEIAPIMEKINQLQEEAGAGPILLESLATISYQVHEPKAPARALGFRAPKGFARSVRTIAGTMIFIVVEDHPLAKLAKLEAAKFTNYDHSYSLDQDTFGRGMYAGFGSGPQSKSVSISSMLKPFNMLVQYSTEVPQTYGTVAELSSAIMAPVASYMLEGIEIISEGITTSVNDMVTEVVMQFQAHNVYQLSISHANEILIDKEASLAALDASVDQYLESERAGYEKRERARRVQEAKEYREAVESLRGPGIAPPYRGSE